MVYVRVWLRRIVCLRLRCVCGGGWFMNYMASHINLTWHIFSLKQLPLSVMLRTVMFSCVTLVLCVQHTHTFSPLAAFISLWFIPLVWFCVCAHMKYPHIPISVCRVTIFLLINAHSQMLTQSHLLFQHPSPSSPISLASIMVWLAAVHPRYVCRWFPGHAVAACQSAEGLQAELWKRSWDHTTAPGRWQRDRERYALLSSDCVTHPRRTNSRVFAPSCTFSIFPVSRSKL